MVRRWAGLVGVVLVLGLAEYRGRCGAQEPLPVPGPPAGWQLGDCPPAPEPTAHGPFGSPASAWFAGVEVGLFVPVTPTGTVATRTNVTLAPAPEAGVQLGYRFDDGSAFGVTYRNLSARSGNSTAPDGGPVPAHLRLEVNSLDLDYLSQEMPGLFGDRVSWQAGVRVASKLLDSRGSDFYTEMSAHNLFTGAGPHLGLTDSVRVGRNGFGLFSRVEVALLFGGEQTRFESAPLPAYGDFGASAPYRSTSTSALGDASARLGVDWAGTVGQRFWVRAAAGVEAEFVGFGQAQLIDFGNNNTRLRDGVGGVGAFFRCEISY